MISPGALTTLHCAALAQAASATPDGERQQLQNAVDQALLSVSLKCEGLSGRTLRKLPLLAFRCTGCPV